MPMAALQPEYADHHTVRRLFGLSRSRVYQLAGEGRIRTVKLCRPGAAKGRRLFDCASIRALLQSASASAPAVAEPASPAQGEVMAAKIG